MQIQKRSLPLYIFLNCITLGIYGLIISMQMGKEIDALSKGDGEETRFGFGGAIMFRGIAPILGLIVGLIVGLNGAESVLGSYLPFEGLDFLAFFLDLGEYKTIMVFSYMIVFGVIFTLIGSGFSGIYLNYWWYKQANRLKLNANRYDLVIKENGTDSFIFRTILEIAFLPITLLVIGLSLLIPALIVWLCIKASAALAAVLATLFVISVLMFGSEMTTGAYLSMNSIMKNMNRLSDASKNGAKPFDPMAYEYYPSVNSLYGNFLPDMINSRTAVAGKANNMPIDNEIIGTTPLTDRIAVGRITGLKGTCAGYNFDLNTGEEVIIGKDAKVASVVIDPAFKEISRKHVGISYDIIQDVYHVTDYSSNGTWADGQKLVRAYPTTLNHGTILKLATDKNTFKLG